MGPPQSRSYALLEWFGEMLLPGSILGCIGGAFMILGGSTSNAAGGITLFVASVAGLTTGPLIRLLVNVAKDIEEAKEHLATIDQYFRYRNSRKNDD